MNAIAPRLSAPATKTGHMGKAWKIDLAEWRRKNLASGAQVCAWIVEAPWAHPMWHSYLVTAVHLRPLDGFPPAIISLHGATHEVQLVALDPLYTATLGKFPHYLTPLNFVGQWIAESDEAAAAKIEACVDEIIIGKLSPDTDHRSQWIARFSDSNIKKEWKGLEDATLVGKAPNGSLVVVGTGKTAAEIITTAAAGPVPAKKDLH